MAVDQESDEPIPLAVPLAVQGGEQLAHFVLGQVLADSIGRVRLAPVCSDLPFRQGGAASEGLVRAARCAGPRAENVVKDVGLLEVVQLFFRTNKGSRGKTAIGKVIEKNIVGYKLQDWNDAPTSELCQPTAQFLHIRNA
jgi:hypothetical protein